MTELAGANAPVSERAPAFAELDEQGRKELWAALALRHTDGLGPRFSARLARAFGGAYEAVCAANIPSAWEDAGVPRALALELGRDAWRENARVEWERLRAASCGILLRTNPAFPEALSHMVDAPLFLYCIGDIGLLRSPAVAVVGSRLSTPRGMAAAANIAHGLSRHGITVVSGLARGIDRIAHLAALRGIGSSIAVLGAGIDSPYPKGSADARQELVEHGLILSEYGPGVTARPESFPIRNRIISGLALAVVVAEATERSGSLITARLALEQGRDVYAVDGPAEEPSFAGCRSLLSQGAKAVSSAEDVLANLAGELNRYLLPPPQPGGPACLEGLDRPVEGGMKKKRVPPKAAQGARAKSAPPAPKKPPMPRLPLPEGIEPEARQVLDFLRENPDAHLDDICRDCNLDAAAASRCVLLMELSGLICQMPGMRYRLI